jgi:hypothetical protein
MRQGSIVGRMLAAAGLASGAALLPAAGCDEDVGEGDQPGIYTVRVSVEGNGREVQGTTNGSQAPSLSGDGNIVAFHSDSGQLVGTDGFVGNDVFVKNRLTGAVELLSRRFINADPTPTGPSTNPSISRDGRYVAFESAGQLAAGVGPQTIIYRYDRMLNVMRAVWPATTPNGAMTNASISADGRWIAFASAATNLVGGLTYPTPGAAQIYVADMNPVTPAFTLVSRSTGSATTAANGPCSVPRISAVGQPLTTTMTVAFQSAATNLGGSPILSAVYAVDFDTGTSAAGAPEVVSTNNFEPSFDTAISADGNLVAYTTPDPTVVPGSGDILTGIILRDRAAASLTLVSLDSSGATVFNSGRPWLSDDGQILAWEAPPQAAGAGATQIWVRNLATGMTQFASVNIRGERAGINCQGPALSGDGRVVGWSSRASNLIAVDTNGLHDVFVRTPVR